MEQRGQLHGVVSWDEQIRKGKQRGGDEGAREGKGGGGGGQKLHLVGCQDWCLPEPEIQQPAQQHQFASQAQLLQQFLQKVQHLSHMVTLLQLC